MSLFGLGAALNKVEQRRREREAARDKMYTVMSHMGTSIGNLKKNALEDRAIMETEAKERMQASARQELAQLLDQRPTVSVGDLDAEKYADVDNDDIFAGETAEGPSTFNPATPGSRFEETNQLGQGAPTEVKFDGKTHTEPPSQIYSVESERPPEPVDLTPSPEMLADQPSEPLRHITEEAISSIASRIAAESGMDEQRAYAYVSAQLHDMKAAKLKEIREAGKEKREAETHNQRMRESDLRISRSIFDLGFDETRTAALQQVTDDMVNGIDNLDGMREGTESFEYWNPLLSKYDAMPAGGLTEFQGLPESRKKRVLANLKDEHRVRLEYALRAAGKQSANKLKDPRKFVRMMMHSRGAQEEVTSYRGTGKEREEVRDKADMVFGAADMVRQSEQTFKIMKVLGDENAWTRGRKVRADVVDAVRGAMNFADAKQAEAWLRDSGFVDKNQRVVQPLRSLSQKLFSERLKRLAGAAVSDQELKRHSAYFPVLDQGDDPVVFKMKILAWYDMVLADAKRGIKGYRGVQNIQYLEDAVRGLEFSGATMYRDGKMNPKDVNRALKYIRESSAPAELKAAAAARYKGVITEKDADPSSAGTFE
jgi:hypothetical protein